MRITLADISEKTGYSKSTVSIALRNDARLPESTRKQIQRVAKDLGYTPDPSLSMIAAHRWRRREEGAGSNVALLFDSQSPAKEVLKEYVAAARDRARALGYHFESFDVRDYRSGQSLSRVLLNRGIKGVIIPPVFDEEVFDGFEWGRFSGVCCGIGFWRPPYHLVTTDVFASVQIAVRKTLEAGYKRIGAALFLHPRTAEDDARRFGAAFYELKMDAAEGLELEVLYSDPVDGDAFREWAKATRPEATIALHRGAYYWLLECGFRIPDEMAFSCLVNVGAESMAGTDPQHAQIGSTAAEMLDLAVRHNELGPPEKPRTILVAPEWIPGPTLQERAPPAKRRAAAAR